MLTPPNPDEVVREERRLSNASAVSNASSAHKSDHDNSHLLPPEPEPEEIVAKLIHQRRPSTITSHTLSTVLKQIFTEKKIREDGIPQEIITNLYLGSIGAAKNLQWLLSNGITHVLCVAGGIGACYCCAGFFGCSKC